MDTDDLSNETYDAVMIQAEKYGHNLTLQFGDWRQIAQMITTI